MSLRSKLGTFVLTRQEQRTIAFIVLVVILGLLTQHYRHRPSKPPPPNDTVQATPAKSPPASRR